MLVTPELHLPDNFHGNYWHKYKMLRPRLIETQENHQDWLKGEKRLNHDQPRQVKGCWDRDFFESLAKHCYQQAVDRLKLQSEPL